MQLIAKVIGLAAVLGAGVMIAYQTHASLKARRKREFIERLTAGKFVKFYTCYTAVLTPDKLRRMELRMREKGYFETAKSLRLLREGR